MNYYIYSITNTITGGINNFQYLILFVCCGDMVDKVEHKYIQDSDCYNIINKKGNIPFPSACTYNNLLQP